MKNRSIRLWGMFIITFFIFTMQIFLQSNSVIAASGIRIYNYTTKKEYTYKDLQVKVTYNGKKISVDSTPGLIESNIALVPYKDIFARSAVKADCVYDKAKGTVSISKYGTTIVLKIGSKEAYINGKKTTAPVAPVKIKYVNENVTKILVPSRFVFENLGYEYTWNKSTCTVSVNRKSFPLLLSYDDGEKFYYNGTQGNVTIDGQEVNLGNMPSIITNNTAMLRAKRVFADTKINASYKYNSSDKTITLSRNGNTLKMKVGSPVAHLNGKAVVLDTAPMIVTNHDVGTSYVMVPGSFTASCLGFDYRWDKNSMTSIITSRKDEVITDESTDDYSVPGQDNDSAPGQTQDNAPEQTQDNAPEQTQENAPEQTQDNAPELGDSPVTWDRGTVIQQWDGFSNLLGKSSGVHNIDNGTSDIYGYIYTVTKDYSDVKINSETYAIVADSPFSTVTSQVNGRQIMLHASNMNIYPNTYYLGNYSGNMIDTICTYNAEDMSCKLEFNVLSEKFTYDLSLSSDKKTLYLTIYFNSLNNVTIGTNDTMDYITLTGSKPLDVVINKMPGVFYMELPNMKKNINDQYISIYNGKVINFVNLYHTTNSTLIYLGLMEDSDYYIVEEGNNYTIMFPKKDEPFSPPILPEPTEPGIPVVPEYPIADISDFELIIPNPASITVNQIKHEDQYRLLRFAIRIPGDYTSYINDNSIIVNSSVIKDVSVFLNSNYETEILVSTSVLQGYEIFADADFIYVNVGNPRDIYKNIVVLDPGHGGPAPGARYFETNEKDINFKILYEICKDFFNSNPSQLKVYYTRESDIDISLADRAAFADMIGADLFVSLHMNANTNASIYGTEIYYSNNNNKKNKAGLNSETLANIFVNSLSGALNTKNRGTRAAKYTVVHNNTVPAILIELGFMSNKNDFAKISDPAFQYEAARVIYETLLQVFELYPTGR